MSQGCLHSHVSCHVVPPQGNRYIYDDAIYTRTKMSTRDFLFHEDLIESVPGWLNWLCLVSSGYDPGVLGESPALVS